VVEPAPPRRPDDSLAVRESDANAVRFVQTPNSTNGSIVFGGDGRLIVTPPLNVLTPALRMIVEGPANGPRPQPDQDRHQLGGRGEDRDSDGLAMRSAHPPPPRGGRHARRALIATFLLSAHPAGDRAAVHHQREVELRRQRVHQHPQHRARPARATDEPAVQRPAAGAGAGGTNDLPPNLPDPTTGVPSATSPINTLSVTYSVQLFQETPPITAGNKWVFTPVAAGSGWDFKRVDVTVTSKSFNTPSGLGIGARTARVSGFIRNPSPGLP
jgi:hypothetical protein